MKTIIRNLRFSATALRAAIILCLTTASVGTWAQTTPQPTPRYVGTLASSGRKINSISLSGTTTPQQTITCGDNSSYSNKTSEHFTVLPGETITVRFTLNGGSWINGYVYVDEDKNGIFTYTQDNTSHTAGGELKGYSYFCFGASNDEHGYTDAGNYVAKSGNLLNPSPFVAPLTEGDYCMRFKTDWNSIDPAGGNEFQTASGTIVDIILHVESHETHEITSLSDIPNNATGTYVLKNDINATNATIIDGFAGTLDGGFHKITGLTHALFSSINGGTVKNVILDNVNITSGTNVGAIANEASGNARIYNCGVLATTSSTISGSDNVGSIVGMLSGNARVLNCFSYANVSGGTVGGIVGSNSGTSANNSTALGTTGTLIMNCAYFGKETGSSIYPVYGGNNITNVATNASSTAMNTYNYFIYDRNTTYSSTNSARAIVEESYFNRFDFCRSILNSNKNLVAMYIYGTQNVTAEQKAEVAHWKYDREVAEFLCLEPWPTNTRRTLEREIPLTTEDYKGKQVGSVSCTFVINGSSCTKTLPLTDMNIEKWDYTWGKIVLPFANEFSDWSLNSTNSADFDNVITGWEITSISGGTPGTYSDYNLCDPECTNKDLYSNNNYVWAQGGNFVVPTGVTSVVFTAHIVRGVYLRDAYPDIAYTSDYKTACNLGTTQPTTFTNARGESKTVYTTLTAAFDKLNDNVANPADQAIVLVGNYHFNQSLEPIIFIGIDYGTTSVPKKGVTFMSIDEDRNQDPDYCFYQYHGGAKNTGGRSSTPPIRFDFIPCPGIGLASYTGGAYVPDFSIILSKGWFETTETFTGIFTETEIHGSSFNQEAPWIANGGIFNGILHASNRSTSNENLQYTRIGGKAYIKNFYPGKKGSNGTIKLKPVNVCGGEIECCYMTGEQHNQGTSNNVRFWCNGGYIHEFLGAYQEKVAGDVIAKIDHALIDAFYGGGGDDAYGSTAQITGNINITCNNSYVKFFCGGPKYGNMAAGKSVTVNATRSTFDEYYGAGFGGTALTAGVRSGNGGVKFTSSSGDVEFFNISTPPAFTYYTNDRLKNTTYGIGTSYILSFSMYAGGDGKGLAFITPKYASLSLATAGAVTSTMKNCTFNNDFYGGGCRGSVTGDIVSTLDDCIVKGSAFGGGYTSSITTCEVYPTTCPNQSVFVKAYGIFTHFGTVEPEVYTWKQVTSTEWNNATIKGNQSTKEIFTTVDMSKMGGVSGDIKLTVIGNTQVTGNIFGGGNESPSAASTKVEVKGTTTVGHDVYGGGNAAPVGASTDVLIDGTDVKINGSVFGGGLGEPATVGTNTKVQLKDKVNVANNVYGGGNGGAVEGNTEVIIGEQ